MCYFPGQIRPICRLSEFYGVDSHIELEELYQTLLFMRSGSYLILKSDSLKLIKELQVEKIVSQKVMS
jgi:hypothetical protein